MLMNPEKNEYADLIEQLLPLYGRAEFENILVSKTQAMSEPARFLLKSKLAYLMKPCFLEIDLRGRVLGQCQSYQLSGITHWLDDVAMNLYNQRINVYRSYTVGLHEELHNTHNNYRVMAQSASVSETSIEQDDQDKFLVEGIRFGYYLNRKEMRLKIKTPVIIVLASGERIHGISINLSMTGCKLKVPLAFDYSLKDIVKVNFPELMSSSEPDGQETKKKASKEQITDLMYEVLTIVDSQHCRWLALRLLDDASIMETLIKNYNDKYQRDLRTDNEDHIQQVRTRGYELCFVKHTTSLPIYLNQHHIRYCLLTERNQTLWQYWHNEFNQPIINGLLTQTRFEEIIPSEQESYRKVTIYCFTHTQNQKTYFYSATHEELTEEQRQLFWHVGVTRPSWRVYQLIISKIYYEDVQQLNNVAPNMSRILSSLTHIAVLHDLTQEQTRADYRLQGSIELDVNILNKFRHPRMPLFEGQALLFDPVPQRTEPRYEYSTEVSIRHGDKEAILAVTNDFSARGLFITLHEPLMAQKDDLVYVTFVELLTQNEAIPLKNLVYYIIQISPDRKQIRLISSSGSEAQEATLFLNRLIKFNIAKLQVSEETLPERPLLYAMHQVLLTRLSGLASLPFYISKIDHIVRPVLLAYNNPETSLTQLLRQVNNKRYFSLCSIFKNRIQELLVAPIRARQAPISYNEIYLSVSYQNGALVQIQSKALFEFDSIGERLTFITNALSHGDFFAIKVITMPIQNALASFSHDELIDLNKKEHYRAANLERELVSLVGFGELVDITQEVLQRFKINQSE